MQQKKYFSLLCFSGAGSKLLQAQLNNAEDVFSIPAYPLMYFPLFFDEWKIKYKNLTNSKILQLIIRHHKSIIDSRYFRGFNGLNKLGKNQSSFIRINQKKFKKGFLEFMANKIINQKNIILGIHHAYQFAIKDKSKNILYHNHSIEIYNKYLVDDFRESKVLAITRSPIYNFWRRAYADENIEKERYDKTDCEYIKNYRYINRLRDLYLNFKNLNQKFKKNCLFYTFEKLKTDNSSFLKKVCKILRLKFNYKKIQNPKFNNKIWIGDKIYKGFDKKKTFIKDNFNSSEDLKSFNQYEIFVLEMALLPFIKKFRYERVKNTQNKLVDKFNFFLKLMIPTKYGLKLFFSRFSPKYFCSYICSLSKEIFKKKSMKNYYQNGMYRFKWSYRITYLININILRKLAYYSNNNYLINISFFFSKLLIYFFLQIEMFFLYFIRIYLILYLYFTVKKKVKYMKVVF